MTLRSVAAHTKIVISGVKNWIKLN